MAQLVKNPPAVWETWARSLGWENPLETGKDTCRTEDGALEVKMLRVTEDCSPVSHRDSGQ